MRALFKDIFREIRHSFSRFLSIFFMVLLGVAFFAGIKATCPDMKLTADRYFDDYHLMDIRVVSTMGLSDKDVTAIRRINHISDVYPTHSTDALTVVDNKELVLKVIALHGSGDASRINSVKLVAGRMPQNSGECVAERGKIVDQGIRIGSRLSLASGTDKDIGDTLKNSVYTVVGFVQTPYYISYDRGVSSIGSGKINYYIMIPPEDFNLSIYTDIFLTVDGAAALPCYSDAYTDTVKPVKTALTDISANREKARYDDIVAEAQDKLSDGKKELSDAEDKQRTELAKAQKKLDDAKTKIDKGEKDIDKNERKFKREVSKARAALNAGYKKLTAGEKEYAKQYELYTAAKKQAQQELPAAKAKIDAAIKQIAQNEAALNQLKYLLAHDPTLTEAAKAKLQAQITAGEAQLAQAKAQVAAAESELAAKQKQLTDAGNTLKSTRALLDKSKKTLDSKKAQLASTIHKTEKRLDDAKKDLSDARKKYADGQKEYRDKKQDSDTKIADAKKKIADGEADIRDIDMPEWYVLGRDTNPGFVDYGQAADRMDAIAKVFPVIFILIAALVCLTTMTRMVDEQRTYIGMLKALGYSKASIAAKYLLYAAFASVTGSVAGVFLGYWIFPTVISNAYGIMYTVPPVITAFNTEYAAISIGFSVLVTTLTALAACYRELAASPAALMRPKAPRPGKRVFLERIPFIWSRMNFSRKITTRNIFRYKKRLLMTVIGIAGCTALLLAGFGLMDSIMSIASKQFNELYRYSMTVTLNDGKDVNREAVRQSLKSDPRVTDILFAKEKTVTVKKDGIEKTASLYIPEQSAKLPEFILLRDRTTGKAVPFGEDGVVLTEKIAAQLWAKVGDTVQLKEGDTHFVTARVTGITENYVYHYVYMSAPLYKQLYGKDADFGEVVARTSGTDESFENTLAADLIKVDGISAVTFTTNISRNFNDIIHSLYYIVLVLIVSAGLLAIVVLYNLTNINILERLREIATIKVLGFYDLEVSAYVYRENVILTAIGMVLGMFLGIFLHQFIVVTAEVDYVMFGRQIFTLSYVYSALLTVFFSGFVNFVMFFRLRRINMVESLKSVD